MNWNQNVCMGTPPRVIFQACIATHLAIARRRPPPPAGRPLRPLTCYPSLASGKGFSFWKGNWQRVCFSDETGSKLKSSTSPKKTESIIRDPFCFRREHEHHKLVESEHEVWLGHYFFCVPSRCPRAPATTSHASHIRIRSV